MATNYDFLEEIRKAVQDRLSNWNVKGIIDTEKNVYVISQDTKLLSKVFELVALPTMLSVAKQYDLEIVPASTQISYPDYSLRSKDLGLQNKWIALDIKSTYIKEKQDDDDITHDETQNVITISDDDHPISGFTLGTFRGCLRDQASTKYSTFPYSNYVEHWCLCIIYRRAKQANEDKKYTLDEFHKIPSVIDNIEVILQPKYKLAWYTPGSGNTANIGSVKSIKAVREGSGPFAELGANVFEDYWINYWRKEDAERVNITQPYKNLKTYIDWKISQQAADGQVDTVLEILKQYQALATSKKREKTKSKRTKKDNK